MQLESTTSAPAAAAAPHEQDIFSNPLIVDETNGALKDIVAFAKKVNVTENSKFESCIQRLLAITKNAVNNTNGDLHKLFLFPDFAPKSLYFEIQRLRHNGESQRYVNGGIIFHGEHDNGGDGSFPTLSVSMEKVNGWSIHT